MTTEDPNGPLVTKSMLDKALDKVDLRFVALEFRFDRLEEKMDRGFAEMNRKFDHIINVLDTFLSRPDNNEINNVARDAKPQRHDRWHLQTTQNYK